MLACVTMCFKVILQKWVPQNSLYFYCGFYYCSILYVYVQALLFLPFCKFLVGRGVSDLSFMSPWYLC